MMRAVIAPRISLSPRRRQLAYLLGLALALKVAYFLEYGALPFLYAPLFDSVVYVHQAESIRAGHFGDPSLLAFGPLYGWFLALVGDAAVPLQLALGLLDVVILFRIVERRWDEDAALASAALYVGYGLLLFYESKLLSETLGFTLALVATYLYTSPRFAIGRFATAIGCGAVLGLATLARANLLLSIPFFVLLAVAPWTRRDEAPPDLRARARRALGLAAGIALVLGANGTWNYAHTGRFVPVILRSRTASLATSHAWDGTLRAFGRDGVASAWDVVDQARAELERSGPAPEAPGIDVAGWIAGSPRKLLGTFSDVETTFQYGYYGERTEVRALALLPVTFGMLLLLGVIGAALVWRRDGPRALLPLLPLAIAVVLTTTLFHPSSRYRLPIVIPLLMLAGPAIVGLARIPQRRTRIALGGLVALACVALAVRTYAYELKSPAMWHLRVAEAEASYGDVSAARARIARARAAGAGDPEVEARIRYVEGITRGDLVRPTTAPARRDPPRRAGSTEGAPEPPR